MTVNIPNYTIKENSICELGKIALQYGKKILVIGGKTALACTRSQIEETFSTNQDVTLEFCWYGGECSKNNIDKIVDAYHLSNFELILGVGGGKALDTSKAVSEILGIKVITIPTIASTCAATTPLSILYNEHGVFDSLYHLSSSPAHIIIDSEIIIKSPWKYLWAGIGDTLAKYYEVDIASRGKSHSHKVLMGIALSNLCVKPLIDNGLAAINASKGNKSNSAFEIVISSIIFSTGLVATFVGDENNGAIAHGLFYGLTTLQEIEAHHLHGEVVAYALLVLLTLDKQYEALNTLLSFYSQIGLPRSLKELNVPCNQLTLKGVLTRTLETPDSLKMPYKIKEEELYDAIFQLENMTCV